MTNEIAYADAAWVSEAAIVSADRHEESPLTWNTENFPELPEDPEHPWSEMTDEERRLKYTVWNQWQTPEDVQADLYEWLLFELEECCYEFVSCHWPNFKLHMDLPTPGWRSSLELLTMIRGAIESPQLAEWEYDGEWTGFLDCLQGALDFRHCAVHRDKDMQISYVLATVNLPNWMRQTDRAARLNRVAKVVTAGFPQQDEDAEESRAVREMIHSRRVHCNSDVEICSKVVDLLRQSSFDRAQTLYPGKVPNDTTYRSFELSHWFHMDRFDVRCHYLRDERTNCAFPDPNEQLMKNTFESAHLLRNDLMHRVNKFCDPSGEVVQFRGSDRFWNHMRSAVKLALLLGDRPRAFEIDFAVRQYMHGLSREQIEQKFSEDHVELIVSGLLQPSSRKELLGKWKDDRSSTKDSMRNDWIIIDILLRGQEQLELVEYQNRPMQRLKALMHRSRQAVVSQYHNVLRPFYERLNVVRNYFLGEGKGEDWTSAEWAAAFNGTWQPRFSDK